MVPGVSDLIAARKDDEGGAKDWREAQCEAFSDHPLDNESEDHPGGADENDRVIKIPDGRALHDDRADHDRVNRQARANQSKPKRGP